MRKKSLGEHCLAYFLGFRSNTEGESVANRASFLRPLRIEPLEDRRLLAGPTVVDPNLAVRTVVSGLAQPTSMAFLGDNDFFVLEKASGRVQHVVSGAVQSTVLDLAVNFGSERGLLGIALHPNFASNDFVYLYWTDSTTGADTAVLANTPLLGNRVDRFVWDGSTLTFDQNLIQLRALQPAFAAEPTPAAGRGNHDGGVIRFGPDGKLYIVIGDTGRRGQMQNLPDGPGSATFPPPAIPVGNLPDDSFGGPEPDNAHLTGVILRLNDDGSSPSDNPFFTAGAKRIGRAATDFDSEVGANLQKIFAYGVRNSFGLAFDPKSGNLWDEQNGDDSFTELNLVEPGANLGWIQVMGPLDRLAQFKAIETGNAPGFPPGTFRGLQQARWSPDNIANTPEEALARMFQVFEEGKEFKATLQGGQENPPTASSATGEAEFELNDDGTLDFELEVENIVGAVAAHIHLGARGQNGPVVAFLFGNVPAPGVNEIDVEGVLTDAQIIARPGFTPTVANLLERMRQGRAYVNVHTVANPGGEIRGQIVVDDEEPVSHYSDPEFSWKFEVAPAGIGFLNGEALGPQYNGDLFTGAARTTLEGGQLFHFNLTGNRSKIAVDDPRLEDRVADNLAKFDITESESLLFGRNFGVSTDIQTGPNGNLFVVSLSNGAVYEIHRAAKEFDANMTGDQEVPGVSTPATGEAKFRLSEDATSLQFEIEVEDIQNVTQAHIHLAPPGTNGPIVASLFGFVAGGVTVDGRLVKGTLTQANLIPRPLIGFGGTMAELIDRMRSGLAYVNVHTVAHPGGEIRGQIMAKLPKGESQGGNLESDANATLAAWWASFDPSSGSSSSSSKRDRMLAIFDPNEVDDDLIADLLST